MPKARFRVFGHPIAGGNIEGPLVAEFQAEGGMHRADNHPVEGACFFVFPLDYAGLNPNFPRAHYQHLMIAHSFDWDTRRGQYVHIPFGGKIEIEAI